jgi:hypothetical protein
MRLPLLGALDPEGIFAYLEHSEYQFTFNKFKTLLE